MSPTNGATSSRRSSPANERFTAWVSGEERRLLRELAAELGSSENYVMRSALRLLVGLPVSPWARERVVELLEHAQRVAV